MTYRHFRAVCIAVVALLAIPCASVADEVKRPTYRIDAAFNDEGNDPWTTSFEVQEGRVTQLPMKSVKRVQVGGSEARVTFNSASLAVPGTNGQVSVPIGHDVQIRVSEGGDHRVLVDVNWQFNESQASASNRLHITGKSVRDVVAVKGREAAEIVLDRNEYGGVRRCIIFTVTPINDNVYPVTYQVFDLLRPTTKDGETTADFAPLVDFISSTIQPHGWDISGGENSITPFAHNLSLVVTAPSQVHDELAKLLAQLRRLQGKEQQE